jgi:hypothetical protein
MVSDVSVKVMHSFTRNFYLLSMMAKEIQNFRQKRSKLRKRRHPFSISNLRTEFQILCYVGRASPNMRVIKPS